jgi:hypothetical protein
MTTAAGKVVHGTGKLIKWTIFAGIGLIVIVVVVAIFSLGNAANKSEKSSKQVNPAQFNALKMGATPSHVRALFGTPESTSTTQVQGLKETCWEYGILAQSGTYQFCFDNGKLSSKLRM